jgi:oligopeptide transport system permease protein
MLVFFLRRLAIAGPTLVLVATLSFFMMHAAPGGPFASDRRLPPEIERRVLAQYGLDQPLGVQYLRYMAGIARGDFGPSLKYKNKTAASLIAAGLPKSAVLGGTALVVGTIAGLCVGAVAALNQNKAPDHLAMALAVLGVCIPTFVTGPILVLVFASTLGWLPTAGWGGVQALILPVAVLALPQTAIISRLARAGLIEALRSDHVRTARAKGVGGARTLLLHALPGALTPLISYLAPAAAGLITGSMVVEEIFSLPGLGKFFVTSALERDYPVVMAVVILYAALILVMNLAAEMLTALIDPRVRLT